MSIILDALRRGRGRHTPRPSSNAAQTDAVLQTLGYGRYKSGSNRFKRFAVLLAAGIVFAIVLWGAVIWITQAYLAPASAPSTAAGASAGQAPASAPSTAAGASAGQASTSAPAAALPTHPASGTPFGAAQGAQSASRAAGKPDKPGAPEALRAAARPVPRRSAPPSPRAAADAPVAPAATSIDQPIVQNSRRANVPESVPAAPTGAPSRTALSVSASPISATVTTGEDHFGRAVIYQRAGDFENALVHYKQLLLRDDLNAEAHNNLGLLYRDKGLLEDAIKEFRRAIAIEPRYARARNNLGVVYLAQRKLDAAASEFHAALAIDPRNVESLVNLSTVEREAGRGEDARSALVHALEIDARNAEAHYNFALLEDEAGNREQAVEHYRAFLQHGVAGYPSLVSEVRKRVALLTR